MTKKIINPTKRMLRLPPLLKAYVAHWAKEHYCSEHSIILYAIEQWAKATYTPEELKQIQREIEKQEGQK